MGQNITARAGFVLCALVGLYFLLTTLYALANAADYATGLPRLLRYVVGPGAIAAGLLACAVFLRPDRRLMVGIYAFTILAALFAFEAFLTLKSTRGSVGLAGYIEGETQSNAPYRSGLPPSYTLKALDIAINAQTQDQAVLSGIPNADVLLCTSGGAPVTYRADRYGFRNPDEIYAQPIKLMVLGDSFAEGICQPDGADIVGQLRKLEPASMNTGSRGAGPLFELAVLQRWGPKYQPKQVVMMFFEGNDWENLERELPLPFLQSALTQGDPGQPDLSAVQLSKSAEVIDRFWQEQSLSLQGYLGRRAWLRNFLALQQTALVLGLHYPKATRDIPEFQDILTTARELVESWGGTFSVAYLPQVDRFVGLIPNRAAFYDQLMRVSDAADEAGVELIDLTGAMYYHPAPRTLYAPDSHFSAEGTAFAADLIMNALNN